MKKEYQTPALTIVQIGIHHHLLSGSDINGTIGDEATKPAKGRRGAWDDDIGDDDQDWDDEE